ncbi:LuxR family transcriptional regulator [Streptomyces sp. NPDC002851]
MSTATEDACEGHEHGVERLCGAGDAAYALAVAEGRIGREEAAEALCLIDLGLLHPDPRDDRWLLPVGPGEVISRLMRDVRADVDAAHRRVAGAAAAVERFAGLGGGGESGGEVIRVLEGMPRIQAATVEAAARCEVENVAIQPGGIRPEEDLVEALTKARGLARRGIRMRSLYTHVARHGQGLYAYLEQIGDVAEVRTLEEVPERLLVFDRTVAFVPGNADRTIALEIRHPALVEYLCTVFERLWRIAVPLAVKLPDRTAIAGVTLRDHSVAALLAEGFADAEIAHRLGINVRTCREHIRKLAETLGSSSRAQLGVRIAQAGLDTPPGVTGRPPEAPTAR